MRKFFNASLMLLLVAAALWQCKTTAPNVPQKAVTGMQYQRYTTGMNGYRGIIFKIYLSDSLSRQEVGALTINDTAVEYALLYPEQGTEIEANVFYESTGMNNPEDAALFFDESYSGSLQVNNKAITLNNFKAVRENEIP